MALLESDRCRREALVVLLRGTYGFECVGAVERVDDICEAAVEGRAEVVLLGGGAVNGEGIACIRELRRSLPSVEVIVRSNPGGVEAVLEALEAGAHGYLLAETRFHEVLDAVVAVVAGGAPFSPSVSRMIAEQFCVEGFVLEDPRHLTGRESEVLAHLSEGGTNKEIATLMEISPETVHCHLKRIYSKLNVRTRTEAQIWFMKRQGKVLEFRSC